MSVIFLILIAIVAGVYIYINEIQQEPNITSNQNGDQTAGNEWKTYSNENWNFQIAYPAGWFYKQQESNGATPIGVHFSDDFNYIEYGSLAPGSSPERRVSLVLYKTNESLEEYFFTDTKNSKLEFKRDISIGDIKGIYAKSVLNDSKTYLSAYIKKDDYIYIFQGVVADETDVTKMEGIFEKLVSSFKFNS